MINYITKEYCNAETPITSEQWRNKSNKERIDLIKEKIKSNNLYKDFEITDATLDGQVTIKIEKTILASERGILLLEFEEMLKISIDKAITIWLEPVGDKSKLRNLRGIKFKSIE